MASSSIPDSAPPPPQYSQTTPTTTQTRSFRPPTFPNIPLHKYRPPYSTSSDDRTTLTIKDPRYANDPIALASLLRDQASLPPRLLLQVSGSHRYSYIVTDFDFSIDMTPMIFRTSEPWNFSTTKDPPGTPSRPTEKSQPGNPVNSPLNIWTTKLCKDKSSVKRIALTRSITNLDTEYIIGAIRNLLSSATVSYKGDVEVRFVLHHARVVYQVGEITTLGRMKSLFGFATKPETADEEGILCYDVISSYWPYATIPPEAQGAREFAVASEAAWWQMWKGPIQNAVLRGRKGWVGMDDWVGLAMGDDLATKTIPWGADANA